MEFKCPHCGRILIRDMRVNINKDQLTRTGNYKSYCEKTGKDAYCKPVK